MPCIGLEWIAARQAKQPNQRRNRKQPQFYAYGERHEDPEKSPSAVVHRASGREVARALSELIGGKIDIQKELVEQVLKIVDQNNDGKVRGCRF